MTPLQPAPVKALPDVDAMLRSVLTRFPELLLALVFGSVARGRQHFESDLDIAVSAKQALTAVQKMDIISELAAQTGRSIDLQDIVSINLSRAVQLFDWLIVHTIVKHHLQDFTAFSKVVQMNLAVQQP